MYKEGISSDGSGSSFSDESEPGFETKTILEGSAAPTSAFYYFHVSLERTELSKTVQKVCNQLPKGGSGLVKPLLCRRVFTTAAQGCEAPSAAGKC